MRSFRFTLLRACVLVALVTLMLAACSKSNNSGGGNPSPTPPPKPQPPAAKYVGCKHASDPKCPCDGWTGDVCQTSTATLAALDPDETKHYPIELGIGQGGSVVIDAPKGKPKFRPVVKQHGTNGKECPPNAFKTHWNAGHGSYTAHQDLGALEQRNSPDPDLVCNYKLGVELSNGKKLDPHIEVRQLYSIQ